MQLEVRSCRSAAEAARVRRFLDREFVVSRNRPPLLARRFPEAFAPDNRDNLVFAAIEGGVAGALVIRCFDWSWDGRRERGAMMGSVWTAPALRGQGVATALLRHARERAASEGASFAVLWTAHSEVYRGAGWRSHDRALRGEWITGSRTGRLHLGAPVNAGIANRLHRARTAMQANGVVRTVRGFAAIPMPAVQVEAFFHEDGYALAGRRADEGFVYEMVGPEAAFDGLVERLRGAFRCVTINCAAESAAQRALARGGRVAWHPQQLAMWLPLARRRPPFERWYVDYLDRI